MPNLKNQHIDGGPVQPVYLMNGAPGGDGNAGFGSNVAVASGTKATSGNTAIIPAPAAGYRICVYTVYIQNETSTPTTLQLIDQVMRFRHVLSDATMNFVLGFELINPWKLNEATALTLNLSGANSHNYSVQYSIEPVG